jgi:hypothetical protein
MASASLGSSSTATPSDDLIRKPLAFMSDNVSDRPIRLVHKSLDGFAPVHGAAIAQLLVFSTIEKISQIVPLFSLW